MTITKSIIVPQNDHDDATLAVSIPEASTDFEVTNTQNSVRDDVYQSASTSTVTITGVVSATRYMNCAFLFKHLLVGASIRFQAFSDAGATSSVYDSGTLPALWWTAAEPYSWSTNTNDPLASEAPYRLYFNDVAYRSYKWTFSGTPTNAAYFQVSRIVVGRYMEFKAHYDADGKLGYVDMSDQGRTRGGSGRTNVGEQYATMDFEVIGGVDQYPTWNDILRRGIGRDVVVSLLPGKGDRNEVILTRCGKLSGLDALGYRINYFTKNLQVKEN